MSEAADLHEMSTQGARSRGVRYYGDVRSWLLFVLVAGCGFQPTSAGAQRDDAPVSIDGRSIDARPIDAPADTSDPLCFGTGPFVVCLPSLPTTPLTLTSNIYTDISSAGKCASDTGQVIDINGVPTCVFAGTTVAVSTGTTGALPLVFVATDSITIGSVDARATLGASAGPNSNAAQCGVLAAAAGSDSASGAGGGAGGTVIGPGGAGGNGNAGAAAGGTNTTPQDLLLLRGGCPGGPGGAGSGTHATGGDGGGAVFAVARNTITINGTLTTSGAGGAGGASYGGGGGGGSGGMIVLDAATLTIGSSAVIMANGGGGGGGATQFSAGSSGSNATTLTGASGGLAASGATDGGVGGFGSTAAASSTQAVAGGGGGGGGGGVGTIYVISGQSISLANASPPPVVAFH